MAKKNPRAIQKFDVCFFASNGDLNEYYEKKPVPGSYDLRRSDYYDKLIWEPNHIFSDLLKYENCYSTNGSAHFIFKSQKNNRRYSMFLSDFNDVMKAGLINGIILQGEFTFCKKGGSQGIRMIIENQDP